MSTITQEKIASLLDIWEELYNYILGLDNPLTQNKELLCSSLYIMRKLINKFLEAMEYEKNKDIIHPDLIRLNNKITSIDHFQV